MTDDRKCHYLKCWPQFFEPTASGLMPFNVRKNDRDFRAGDMVVMYEWDPNTASEAEGYTGREVRGTITQVIEGLGDGYVALGIEWTDGIYPKAGT